MEEVRANRILLKSVSVYGYVSVPYAHEFR